MSYKGQVGVNWGYRKKRLGVSDGADPPLGTKQFTPSNYWAAAAHCENWG
jgi:hypothetical protein